MTRPPWRYLFDGKNGKGSLTIQAAPEKNLKKNVL